MADKLTAEQIEDLLAKGVYTPDQAAAAKIVNGAYNAAPSKPDAPVSSGPGILNTIDKFLPQEGGSYKPTIAPIVNSPVGPSAVNTTIQPPTAPVNAPITNPAISPLAVASVPAKQAPIGGSIISPPPQVPVQSYNSLNISDDDILHKDDKRAELDKKFTDKKLDLQTQLDQEQTKMDIGDKTANPNKIAALKVQLQGLQGEESKALNAFDAANKQYSVDANGNIVDDLSKLPSTLTKKQIADQDSRFHQIGEGNETRAVDRLRTAQQSETDATIARNDAVGAFNVEQGQIAIDNANKRAADRAIAQQEIDKRQNIINQLTDTHAKEQVDPNSVYKNTSTGAAIGTTLLAALTGAFDGLNHLNRPNSVVSAVDKIVANDIEAQKVNIDKHGKDIDRAQNSLSQFIQQGFTKEESQDMYAASLYKAASLKFQGDLAKYDNPIVQAKGAQIVAGLDQEAARRATAANAPYAHAQLTARAAPIAGAGANTGFITSMVGGKLMVRNVKTGQVSEANDEQRSKYYDTENKRATTAKTEASIGAPGKQSAKIKTAIDQSSGIPEALAPVLESYSGVGTNVFGTTAETDSRVNNLATKIAKATGRNPEEIITSWKHAFSNGTAREIITHDAETAEKVRQHLSTPGTGGTEDEKGEDNSGSGE